MIKDIFYLRFIVMNYDDTGLLWMFFVGLFVFFWIYTLLRVAKDISRRTNHLWIQVLCVFVIVLLTPLVGLPVYFLLRPIPRKDVLLAQEEMNELLHAQTIMCATCWSSNLHEHLFCVFCGEKLKHPCSTCHKMFAIWYKYCPYCSQPSPSIWPEQEDW